MKIQGTLHHSDLEGGLWLLTSDSGQVYELLGLEPDLKRDGARLELEGEESSGFSLGMAGTLFEVRGGRAL